MNKQGGRPSPRREKGERGKGNHRISDHRQGNGETQRWLRKGGRGVALSLVQEGQRFNTRKKKKREKELYRMHNAKKISEKGKGFTRLESAGTLGDHVGGEGGHGGEKEGVKSRLTLMKKATVARLGFGGGVVMRWRSCQSKLGIEIEGRFSRDAQEGWKWHSGCRLLLGSRKRVGKTLGRGSGKHLPPAGPGVLDKQS